jgi:uncharacterized protein (DUF2062 family)
VKKEQRQYNIFQKFQRRLKLNFLKLFRSPGGAKKVSLGFALGFGLEMFVIPTASLIYILFYPIVRIARGSLPAAIIGNVIGKLTFLPVILLPFAKKIGGFIFKNKKDNATLHHHSIMNLLHGDFAVVIDLLHGGLHILIGMAIFGVILGFISYYVVGYFYNKEKQRRMAKVSSARSRRVMD